MAREVELDELLEQMPRIAKKFKAFEALVRADEREACAKVCDGLAKPDTIWDIAKNCAAAIRAMENT
jgi:hypothetical protein